VQAAQGATRKPLLGVVTLRVQSAKPHWETLQPTKRAYIRSTISEGKQRRVQGQGQERGQGDGVELC
jgi:hypothetical protein